MRSTSLRPGLGLLFLLLAGCGPANSADGSREPVPEVVERSDRRFLQGNDKEARSILRGYLEETPDSFHATYRLGIHLLFEEPAESARLLEAAERLAPIHPGPVFFRGLGRLAVGDPGGAERHFARADLLRAERMRGRCAIQDTTDAVRTAFAAGRARRFGEAADRLDAEADARPNDAALRYTAAWMRFLSGDVERALDAAERALERRGDLPDARALAGICLLRLGRVPEARAAADAVAQRAPRLASGLFLRGRLSLVDSEYQDALLLFWDAVLEDPSVGLFHEDLGQNLMALGMPETGTGFLQFMEWVAAPR